MGKLVLHLPDGTTLDIALARERVTIGRRADNDVCLPYPAVSGEHAAIVTILADSFLEDLGSTNGTLVNGKPVAKHFLRDGDEIDVGRQKLVYVADAADGTAIDARPAARAPAGRAAPAGGSVPEPDAGNGPAGDPAASNADIERFVASEVGAERAAGAADSPPPAPDPQAPAPVLRVLTGPSAGRELALDNEETIVGRVGVQVAAIRRAGTGYRLAAVEGASPPSINGAPVPPEGGVLAPGDSLQVAGVRLEFVSATDRANPAATG